MKIISGKTSLLDVQKDSINNLIKSRGLTSRVVVTKHFAERIMQRDIEMKDIFSALHKLSSSFCQVLFDFEIGRTPYLDYKDIRVKMDYIDGTVFLMTCYRKDRKHGNSFSSVGNNDKLRR